MTSTPPAPGTGTDADPDPELPTAATVLEAAEHIAGDIVRTPTVHSRTLSAITGADIHVKLENLQFTGSFKDRGAANHLRDLTDEQRSRGLMALSAGNHAQGVAHTASRLGLEATIVMPATAPFAKVVNTEALGATVVQHGATLADARSALDELGREHGFHYVPPYDDPAVIAGQGTVGLELLADVPDLDVIVVPVGGGGLISGIGLAARHLRPDIEIVGAQVAAFAPVAAGFGHAPTGDRGPETLADGIAVKQLGQLTLPLIERLVDDVVIAPEDRIEEAIGLFLEIEKTVSEGAGAIPLAAVLDDPDRFAGRKVGLVLSGGNIDSRVLASVLMRGLVRTGRISTFRVEIGDVPGRLAPLIAAVAEAGANIVEIDHRRLFDPISARSTNVDLVVETRDARHRDRVMAAIRDLGRTVEQVG